MSEEMVTPYADDEPIPERKEQDPDEAYDKWRAALSDKEYDEYRSEGYAELRAEFLRIARAQGK